MRYFLHRIMEGSFPGSPDHDYVEVTEGEITKINAMFRGRWRDTKEQAGETDKENL